MAYKKSNIQQLREMMSRQNGRNTFLEGIFYNPAENDEPGYDYGEDMPMPQQGGAQQQQQQQQGGSAQDVKGIFANIRIAIIQGISMLAETPEAPEYDILKKMLTLIDKPVTAQGVNMQDQE